MPKPLYNFRPESKTSREEPIKRIFFSLILYPVALIAVFIASPVQNSVAETISFKPTDFSLRLPDGFVAEANANLWVAPAKIEAFTEKLSSEEGDSKLIASYFKMENNLAYTFRAYADTPLPFLEDLDATQLANEWVRGMKSMIPGFVSLDMGKFSVGGYNGVTVLGRIGQNGEYACRQFLLSDTLASYKLVYVYPAQAPDFAKTVETSVMSFTAGQPPLKKGKTMMPIILMIAASLAIAAILFSKFREQRLVAAALFICVTCLPAYASAEAAGGNVLFNPPPGYEKVDSETLGSVIKETMAEYFAPEIYPFVSIALPQDEDIDDPLVDYYMIKIYPIITQMPSDKEEMFEQTYVGFNKLENYEKQQLLLMSDNASKFFKLKFAVMIDAKKLYNLILARKMSYGYMVYEVSAPMTDLVTHEALFVQSFVDASIVNTDILDLLIGIPVNWNMLIGTVLLGLVLIFLVFAFLKKRKR